MGNLFLFGALITFHHGCFFLVPYSGHKIFFLSFFDIPSTISFLPHHLYFMLTAPLSLAVFSLHFHALRQLLHYTFFKCSPKTNPCPWFSCVLVPLQSYPLYFTNITTFHLVVHPLCSNAALLRGIPHVLLYSCAFLLLQKK